MASIHLQGNLVDSLGEIDVGAKLTWTHLTTTGEVIETTKRDLIIPPDGFYSIDVEFGQIRLDYTTRFTERFISIVVVNGDSTATTIPELLAASVPPTDAQLLIFQDLLADTVAAKDLAEAAAVQITTLELIGSSAVFPPDQVVTTSGYAVTGDGGKGSWKQNGNNAQPVSQTPSDLADGLLNAGTGNQWALVLDSKILIRMFGASPSNDAATNNLAIQAAINYAETLVDQVSINIDVVTNNVYTGTGRFLITGLLMAQVTDGVQLIGDGQGVSELGCEGVGPAVTFGTEVSTPNFSHVWAKNLSIRGGNPLFTTNDAHIVNGSIGVKGSRLNRNCGIENCQIYGFDENVKLRDCWTFKIRDNHIHDSGTSLVDWQTALNGEMTGNRFDDNAALEPLVTIDAQGTSNQIRDFRVVGNTFQESQVTAIRFLDVSSAWVESNHFENNNKSDSGDHADIEFFQGTSSRLDGTLTLCDNFYSPGAATWTGTEYAVKVDAAKRVQSIGEKTGSSVYNRYMRVESNVDHVSIDGGVFTNMAGDAVSRASTETSIDEHYTKVDGAGITTESVDRYVKGELIGGYGLGMAFTISSTGGSISTDQNRTFFDMTGNGQTLTLREEEETDGRVIEVRKYSTTGTLTVTSAGATQMQLNGSTNNNCILVAARGKAKFIYSAATDTWICMPSEEAAGWVLSA